MYECQCCAHNSVAFGIGPSNEVNAEGLLDCFLALFSLLVAAEE